MHATGPLYIEARRSDQHLVDQQLASIMRFQFRCDKTTTSVPHATVVEFPYGN